jgi:PIN domain nuclease of toxin-antitoxin system
MERYLLDTHTLIWYLSNDPRLPTNVADLLENPDETLLVSVASYWEMAIKLNLGKLTLPVSLEALMSIAYRKDILTLPIGESALLATSKLPLYHRDPFDRMIIAQAITDGLSVVSADEALDAYEVKRVWQSP